MKENKPKKKIAILGSTGSIGTQALDVVREHPELFEISVLTAYSNVDLLRKQAIEFKPNTVVVVREENYEALSDELWVHGIKTYTGEKALSEVVQMDEVDIVLTALVGFAGLRPTVAAIEARKPIALANKETLVVAGEYITTMAAKYQVPILPVDSEHSALFQCVVGEFHNPIEKIYLTASGGPFRGRKQKELEKVSPAEALKHPNWEMGAKITIDSATLMNKGLEVIEAKWLFDLKTEQIDVIVHPESIVHSIVQFEDGSMKAQMGLPDMKLPIQYALAYPNRIKSSFKRFDFMEFPRLNFEKADQETFLNLHLAYEALSMGGTAACALNAANEVTNQAFRNGQIGFLDIAIINQKVLQNIPNKKHPLLEDYFEVDEEARRLATDYIR